MKKAIAIIVLGFLFSGNANAGVNEPGSAHIGAIKNVKSIYYEHLAKVKKKNKNLIHNVSTRKRGSEEGLVFTAKKIKEKSKKKAYKKWRK